MSRRGSRTPDNQDAYLALDELGFFVVSDGMGGHAGGRAASRLAVDTLYQGFVGGTPPESPDDVTRLIMRANWLIHEFARKQPELRGMGATLVACWLNEGSLHCFHVGDSRAYRLRDFVLEQLTADHSPLDREERESGASSRAISRALGMAAEVEVEQQVFDWEVDDVVMLVSDGVTDVLANYEMSNCLVELHGDPVEQVEALLREARKRGSDDDCTVLLVQPPVQPVETGRETVVIDLPAEGH